MDAAPAPDLNYFALIDASPDGSRMTTTSLRVGQVHKKRHTNVLRVIRSRLADIAASASPEFGRLNFELTTYLDPQGTPTPMYLMTQEGYQFIVAKMQGAEAVSHQLAFIRCFKEMAAMLKQQREGLEYRRAKYELADADSERRGRFHGCGLNQRKQEIPGLNAEKKALLELTQPSLQLQ